MTDSCNFNCSSDATSARDKCLLQVLQVDGLIDQTRSSIPGSTDQGQQDVAVSIAI